MLNVENEAGFSRVFYRNENQVSILIQLNRGGARAGEYLRVAETRRTSSLKEIDSEKEQIAKDCKESKKNVKRLDEQVSFSCLPSCKKGTGFILRLLQKISGTFCVVCSEVDSN